MLNITKKNKLGDCQDHMPVCYGSNAMKYSRNRNEATVGIQQTSYESSVPSISTTTSAGSTSMATTGSTTTMATLMEWIWQSLCSYENLELAFKKSRKRKSKLRYVKEFENNLESNLEELRTELLLHSYNPKPLKTFVIRDPKTRTIRKSDFRDRIVHHAICNILDPIFDKTFIYDSFANRKGKGTHNALLRFDKFKRKVSKNNTRNCYILKADIKSYFNDVNQDILISIIRKKVNNEKVIWLINKVLKNHSDKRGMPLGNMTSQFFANVYLNELDHFVKHNLKAKYYIRYVDDFVILSASKEELKIYKNKIKEFLKNKLELDLHKTKCRIIELKKGVLFLGFRIFPHHKLLRKSNIRTIHKRIAQDNYDNVYKYLDGWLSHSSHANTFKLRKNITDNVENRFLGQTSMLEIDRLSRMVEA